MLGELNKDQINNLLSSQVIGRLACSDGKQPYIVPVTYAYDGTFIYGQTNEGNKLKIVRKNPKVCFEADRMTDMRNWQSVLVYGKFEELKGKEATAAREFLFNRIFPLMTSSTIHTYGHEEEGTLENGNRVKQVLYRIRIEKMTGRFEKQ